MKRCYIIVFDLKAPLLNKNSVIEGIHSAKTWAKISDNVYIISTVLSAEQIRDALLKLLYQNDKIYVTLLGNTSAWYGLDQDVSDWIRKQQK
jgi:hypothetical protein